MFQFVTDPTPAEELLWLAQRGNVERAKEIIDANSELVKCQDEDGYSPLHRACYSDQPEMVDVSIAECPGEKKGGFTARTIQDQK